jgi:hypothetical protein
MESDSMNARGKMKDLLCKDIENLKISLEEEKRILEELRAKL